MQLCYPAIFHVDSDSIWVEFPDLQGCQTYADTVAEAASNASEALELYACSLLERGLPLPPAGDISSLKVSGKDFTSLIVGDLSGYLTKDRAVKKTLTIPGWLNEAAMAKNLNFSQTLQDALLQKIAQV